MKYGLALVLGGCLTGAALAQTEPVLEYRPAVGFYHPMAPAILVPRIPGVIYTQSMYMPAMYAPVAPVVTVAKPLVPQQAVPTTPVTEEKASAMPAAEEAPVAPEAPAAPVQVQVETPAAAPAADRVLAAPTFPYLERKPTSEPVRDRKFLWRFGE